MYFGKLIVKIGILCSYLFDHDNVPERKNKLELQTKLLTFDSREQSTSRDYLVPTNRLTKTCSRAALVLTIDKNINRVIKFALLENPI